MIKIRDYSARELRGDIDLLLNRYPFIRAKVIGRSVRWRRIYSLTMGEGKQSVLYCGAHHGLEWITALLIMRFVEELAEHYVTGERFKGCDVRKMLSQRSLVFVPMLNPDGVHNVVRKGMRWQANGRGVDLNHNYAADWERCREIEIKNGITGRCSARFGGSHPESEPETRALTAMVRGGDFVRVVALHSQGREIYYDYKGLEPSGALDLARRMEELSGYSVSTPVESASCGGFKDWFIQEFGREGYTIEVGMGTNPLPLSDFDDIYQDILEMLLLCGYN